ncbi:helix-turn-helix transcriptional regulator [Actinomadura barringtoniae]|uniref:Helix-turn-helix transcriptional regulator n=1 Tax=Actinomadura barringtoniae TaxID=1427535 RepID=A0A939PMS0_9ACTN|nr:helix-turn-helix transcriptional regulator [Actinomadura barringtoniae]
MTVLIAERGYGSFTVGDVAARAGVADNRIYRRWATWRRCSWAWRLPASPRRPRFPTTAAWNRICARTWRVSPATSAGRPAWRSCAW